MNKPNMAKILKSAKTGISKHSPEILTGIGIAGMITTTVLAVKATPKALRLIEEKKKEEGVTELKPIETVKATWKCYIPATVTGVTSVACLIGASKVNARRNAALATAYKLSETALTEYREKVVETIGEKKEQVVREKVADEQIRRNPVSQRDVIITGKGKTLCFDPLSSRYFESDIELIRRAANNLNARILTQIGGYLSLNEFYDELDLPRIDIGDDFGWNLDNRIELDISSHVTEDGQPSLVIGHYNRPDYNYR